MSFLAFSPCAFAFGTSETLPALSPFPSKKKGFRGSVKGKAIKKFYFLPDIKNVCSKFGLPRFTPNFFSPLDTPTGSLYDGYGLGALARYGLQNGFFWCLLTLRIGLPCESLGNKSGEAAFPKNCLLSARSYRQRANTATAVSAVSDAL